MPSHDHEVAICEHGLRYDPSQTAGCVICRRDAEGPVVTSGPQLPVVASSGFGRWIGALLGVAALVALAALIVPGLLESADQGPAPGRAVQARSAAGAAPGGDGRPARSPRGQAPTDPVRSRDGAIAREREEVPPRIDLQERKRVEAEALARARRDVQVVVYTTSWCPHCADAKAFMDSTGIRYTERDIEASEYEASRLERINPRRSIPTFDIEGEVLMGFSSQGLLEAIDRVARRRL